MTVDDVMTTALITASPRETVDQADFDMRLARIRHIPVVDDRNRLVGIISNRDLLRAFDKLGKDSVAIESVMTTEVRTISGDAPARDAVSDLIEYKIGCLPVTGAEGQLIGLVTETDFLRIAHELLSGQFEPEAIREEG